jgi:hypothetical protein
VVDHHTERPEIAGPTQGQRPEVGAATCQADGKSVSDDIDDTATTSHAELHTAVGSGEQGVVAATADVLAGVETGTALTHDDRTCRCNLAVKQLHTQTLGLGVPAVAG